MHTHLTPKSGKTPRYKDSLNLSIMTGFQDFERILYWQREQGVYMAMHEHIALYLSVSYV
jgi:hypothetical protein